MEELGLGLALYGPYIDLLVESSLSAFFTKGEEEGIERI